MGTDYYKMKCPLTSIKLDKFSNTTIVHLFINHDFSGSFQVPNALLDDTLKMFFDTDKKDGHCSAHVKYGDDSIGFIVNIHDKLLPISAQVLSESGELTSISDLINMTGKKRRIKEYELID